MAKVTTKRWFMSRTLWFNAVTILLGVVEVVSGVYPVDPAALGLIVGIGNVLLRFVTEYKLTK